MSLALLSSHQLFQRMDSALRSLLSHHRHQVQTNLSLKPTHPQRPLRVLRVPLVPVRPWLCRGASTRAADAR